MTIFKSKFFMVKMVNLKLLYETKLKMSTLTIDHEET